MDVARGGVRGGAPAHPRSRRMPDCDTLAENYDPAVKPYTPDAAGIACGRAGRDACCAA